MMVSVEVIIIVSLCSNYMSVNSLVKAMSPVIVVWPHQLPF